MLRLLDKLREEPEVKKTQIALWISLFLTSIVFFIWVSVFMQKYLTVSEEERERAAASQNKGGLSSFFDTIDESTARLHESYDVFTGALESIKDTTDILGANEAVVNTATSTKEKSENSAKSGDFLLQKDDNE